MIRIEKIVGNDLVVVVGSVRKGAAAVAVTKGPYSGHAGLQLIVDNNVAALVDRNSGMLETEIAGIGNAADSQENVAAQHFRSAIRAIHVHANSAVALCQGDTFCVQPNLYALRLDDFAHSLGNIFVFSPNQTRAHFYNRDFTAEAAVHLRKLQSDITSAYDNKMLGQEIDRHHRRVVKKRDLLDPRHFGNNGAAAYVDVNLFSFENFIIDRNTVRRLKASMALNHRAVLKPSQPRSEE